MEISSGISLCERPLELASRNAGCRARALALASCSRAEQTLPRTPPSRPASFASGERSRSVAEYTGSRARRQYDVAVDLIVAICEAPSAAMTTSGREDGSDAAAANVASASWPSRNTAARVLRAAGLRVGSICLCKSSSKAADVTGELRLALRCRGRAGPAASTIAGKSRVGAGSLGGRRSRRGASARSRLQRAVSIVRVNGFSTAKDQHSSWGARGDELEAGLGPRRGPGQRGDRGAVESIALTQCTPAATATSSLDSLARSDLSFRAISQRNIAASPRVSVIAFPGRVGVGQPERDCMLDVVGILHQARYSGRLGGLRLVPAPAVVATLRHRRLTGAG